MSAPIVVIGAGASGLMAAYWAARGERPVVLLEGTPDGGRKILASGGGRCNILPSVAAPERFLTASSPNTLRNILRSWPLHEQRAFFEETLGLPLQEEEGSGKLFPVCNRAKAVRDALVEAVRQSGVALRFGARAAALSPTPSGWQVLLAEGESLAASSVILAAGGASLPATGSDGWGMEALRRLGHTVHAPYPALAPLVAEGAPHRTLAGISLEVSAEAPGCLLRPKSCGGFLFTHRGYSGPAVLDISHAVARPRPDGRRQEILISWTHHTEHEWEGLLLASKAGLASAISRHIPSRLAETLCAEAGVNAETRVAQLRKEARRELLRLLTRYPLPWTGDEGYAKAEVTAGGVDLREVDRKTLQSKRHPGLFLCGEVLDAAGPIGGHNFQWAWATGRAAGLGAAAEP